jgi:hypothetical protein
LTGSDEPTVQLWTSIDNQKPGCNLAGFLISNFCWLFAHLLFRVFTRQRLLALV